jgi:cation diffusion facilitator family transporter
MANIESGVRLSKLALLINATLALLKIAGGILGQSYVLVADGIESTADIFSSIVVWGGLRLAVRPADEKHPYGHGKAEPIASVLVAFLLLGVAFWIAIQSLQEIQQPHAAPSWFTLPLLLLVIVVKEVLFRWVSRTAHSLESSALMGDAWHHRSDALTSAAAFIGIAIALVGGRGYESADDWAALAACSVIVWNGFRLLRGALDEIMDASVSPEVVDAVRRIAADVEGVADIDKCRVRKVGLHLALDIHVRVDGGLSVRCGHEIAHRVKDRLMASPHRINDVIVHIEPAPDGPPESASVVSRK